MIILEFEAPVRERLHRYYYSITTYPLKEEQEGLWWDETEKRWTTWENRVFANGCGTHLRCRTLRAFKSHLRKHRETLRDYEVVLVSRYQGHNIVARYE